MNRKTLIIGLSAILIIAILVSIYVGFITNFVPQRATVLCLPTVFSSGVNTAVRITTINPITEKPLPNSKVALYIKSETDKASLDTKLLYEGKTNADGILNANFKMPDVNDGNYKMIVKTEYANGKDETERTITITRDFKILLTTDKPLYQPNQTMHIRSLALSRATLAPISKQDITIEVEDPKGTKVFKKILKSSDYGIASCDFTLADEINLGRYTIRATLGNTSSEKKVTVEKYVLPKFKVELTTDKKFYLPGQSITGKVSANYFFGKSVSGGNVSIKLSTYDVEVSTIGEIKGKTDIDGNFQFEYNLPTYFAGHPLEKGNALLLFEIEITDKAEHKESITKEFVISQYPLEVTAIPESGQLVQGVENIIYFITNYPDGTPTSATIEFMGQRIKTDLAGLGECRVTVSNLYDFQSVNISVYDNSGNRIDKNINLYQYDYRDYYNQLLLRPDKAIYRIGDTAKFTVLSARNGTAYFDIIRGNQTILTQSIKVNNGKGVLEVDLTPDMFGSIEIHAYMLSFKDDRHQGQIIRDTRIIYVESPQSLVVNVSTDKDTYLPGEDAKINFDVKDDKGNPTLSALGVDIVDESVFALQEMHPGMEKVYFTLHNDMMEPRYQIKYSLEQVLEYQRTRDEGRGTDDSKLTADNQQSTINNRIAQVVLASIASKRSEPILLNTYTKRFDNAENFKENFFSAVWQVPIWLMILTLCISCILSISVIHAGRPLQLEESSENILQNIDALAKPFYRSYIFFFLLPICTIFVGIILLIIFPYNDEKIGMFFLGAGTVELIYFFIQNIHLNVKLSSNDLIKKNSKLSFIIFATSTILVLFVLSIVSLIIAGTQDIQPTASFFVGIIIFFILSFVYFYLLPKSFDRFLGKKTKVIWKAILVSVCILALFVIALSLPSFMRFQARGRVSSIKSIERGAMIEAEDKVKDSTLEGKKDISTESISAQDKESIRVRKYFPETLYSNPEIITDEKGKASIILKVADSITSWRLSALAVSLKGLLGSVTKNIRVFQDFFVDIDLPVSLTQNDEISIPIAVYNYLSEGQNVKLEMEKGDWFQFIGESVKSVYLAKNEVNVVYFRIKVIKIGMHKLTVYALGSKMSDAISREIEVKPDGKEVLFTVSDRLDKNVSQIVDIPQSAIDDASKIFVKIYPGVYSQVVEGLDGMLKMPFG